MQLDMLQKLADRAKKEEGFIDTLPDEWRVEVEALLEAQDAT